ncbi:MAG: hypothetical protein ABI813_06600 [Bacteroidota bacterium]
MSTIHPGFFEETQDLAESYFNNRLRFFKLQTAGKSSRVATLFFTAIITGFLSFFVLLFLSIMATYYFSEKLHSPF